MIDTIKIQEKTVNFILLILLIIQPILDVISFFMMQNEMTAITTVLRMLLFAALVVFSFLISDHKKSYIIMCTVLGVFWILHMIGCYQDGYQSLFQDIAMYMRTIQMPLMTLCFITFFKKGNQIPKVIRFGFFCNYITITMVILLSYLFGMPESTYQTGIGIKGWFAIGNAQSCIVALLGPLTIYFAMKTKNHLYFVLISILVFANLFLFGTKVTLYTIYIIIIGNLILLLINRKKTIFIYSFFVLCLAAGVLGYEMSPCYQNQYRMGISLGEWDSDIAKLEEAHNINKAETEEDRQNINFDDYLEIYNLYNKPLVDRFGIENVVRKYNFSTSAKDLINNRNLKVNFSSLMMDEKSTMVHLFGFEYMDFISEGNIYDPENDFPAIYFSNGAIGLTMYLGFIGYFLLLIIRKLMKDFKGSFTLENGAVAITLLLMLGAAQLSGNVLRRPNVSIYLSLILAYVYYLCVLKKTSKE